MSVTLVGRKVVGGCVEGEALVTRETISGWGGVNPMNGSVVETRHELRGQSFKGKALVFPCAKGSPAGPPCFTWRASPAPRPKQCCSTR